MAIGQAWLARCVLGLVRHGDDSRPHEFCCAWVRGLVACIEPKSFAEAGLTSGNHV
jgi:hypothetical protein